jgi:predicted NUDIX family NTP pyrophosphohydrolase
VAAKRSAGILLFRRPGESEGGGEGEGPGAGGGPEVLLGHMGGPFWARKDAAAWSVVKGEYDEDEGAEAAARREFTEELGLPVPDGTPVPLGEVRQSGGKTVTAWALEGDLDPAAVVPGTFTLEWPRGSGTLREFPELDRVAWFGLAEAREKIVKGQRAFLDRLAEHLGVPPPAG